MSSNKREERPAQKQEEDNTPLPPTSQDPLFVNTRAHMVDCGCGHSHSCEWCGGSGKITSAVAKARNRQRKRDNDGR